ncbi:IclR family transcriptional regulator [Microbaculum marinum]|uniref:IclR family transcriptional regulator n=1 Tax=Microbaculum marinum TaxID=1764581 RepID=A0AAW9RZ87_9HYPH
MRVLAVLRAAAEAEGPISIKSVAQELGLAQSTVHRMFDLLVSEDFLRQDPHTRRYGIGAEYYRVATLVANSHSFGDFAGPSLEWLTEKTGETAAFALYLHGTGRMVFTAVSDSPHSLRYRLDARQRFPIVWGASGLAILAFLPEDEQAAVIAAAEPSPVTGALIDPAALRKRLRGIRKDGWAWSQSEKIPESVGIAAPVMSAGRVTGCLALTIPSFRFDASILPKYGRLVADAAEALSVRPGKESDD